MTEYPDSECEAHRDVRTISPVCVVCMANEVERLRGALQELVDLKGMKEASRSHTSMKRSLELQAEYERRKPAAWRRAHLALKGEDEG